MRPDQPQPAAGPMPAAVATGTTMAGS